MNRFLLVALITIMFTGCSKDEHQTVEGQDFYYKNLNNYEIDYNHSINLDLNNDGNIDYAFAASVITDYLVEKLEFRAYTLNGSLLYNDDVTPKVFDKDEKIKTGNSSTYGWTQKNAFLAFRIYTEDPSSPTWEGAWKGKTNKYLGIKIKSGNKFYTGWIRMSIGGMQSKIILHDYAFNKTPGADIEAGETK